MDEEKYGIDIEFAHDRAKALIPEEFFWSCVDELAPFGSDEGDTALAEFRTWRTQYPDAPTIECMKWVIESVGEMDFAEYNDSLTDPSTVAEAVEDEAFDDHQYIFTLDVSVIATGFAQLVDEGIIEAENKPVIQLAIDRQRVWAKVLDNWEHAGEYLINLDVLERALSKA
ncbi:hypothetical protein LZZ85_08525 [Terrimonas sp. NA20]|uniref:DUF4240 domain-containing protein n=1 Tax=Terrimonas ginsenosidimutans TaxID=2908004 RepID=A0ABS9KPX9_9BACT|nr:hypothetical protein [Terrimonas ginsenosidimutans]MCG2614325.1 hypothetical protein [Terrimonas ginsenosidimutans]